MKESAFNELLESVKETIAISHNEIEPSRVWSVTQNNRTEVQKVTNSITSDTKEVKEIVFA